MSRIDYMALLDKMLENPDEKIFRTRQFEQNSSSTVKDEGELTPIGECDMPF